MDPHLCKLDMNHVPKTTTKAAMETIMVQMCAEKLTTDFSDLLGAMIILFVSSPAGLTGVACDMSSAKFVK